VIPFAVLWQYVKVLLGEHRLELHNVGGQQSGSSEYLLTVSGSFCEILGGHSHSSEVDLGKLQEDTCKEQSVFKLPIRAVHLQRHFFKLFLEQEYGSIITRLKGPEFSSLLAGLFLL